MNELNPKMNKKIAPVSADGQDVHITCTSTPLSDLPGSRPEAIDKGLLDGLFYGFFGYLVSGDEVIRNIQHEQAIAKHKRVGGRIEID